MHDRDHSTSLHRKLPDPRIVLAAEPGLALIALAEADLPLLRRWFEAPHIRRWWNPPSEALAEDAAHLGGDNVSPFLTVAGECPVGYLQVYHANGDAFWDGHVLPRETFGIDHFLGEADVIGCGLGPRLLGIAIARLFEMPAVTRIQADPHPENVSSIRAFEKAGFRGQARIDTPDGPAWYMAIDRAPLGRRP